MAKYEVEVKDIPVRYSRQTYPAGATFLMDERHLKGMDELLTVLGEVEEPEKTVDEMTLVELKEYAEKNTIDLGGKTKKDEILAAIKAAQ